MKKKNRVFHLALCFGFLFSIVSLSWAKDTVYMTQEEAVKWAFSAAAAIEEAKVVLSPAEKKEIEAATGGALYASDDKIYIGTVSGKLDGYAMITNEIGKFEFITFIVKVTPKMEIEKVGVMVYRESRGGEINRKRFQQQYHGKKKTDPFKVNHDIINITGATMSVRAMNRGIRKVFALLDHYLKDDSATQKKSL